VNGFKIFNIYLSPSNIRFIIYAICMPKNKFSNNIERLANKKIKKRLLILKE